MSADREHIDPITAERLIRGARGGSPVGSDRLAELLAAATYPPSRGELTGEEAAVTAFRAARLASTPESRRKPMLKTALAKLATAKVAIVLAAVGGGGVALAAGSGHLPGATTDHHASDRPTGSASGSAHASGGHGSPSAAAHSSAAAAESAAADRSATPNGSPSPNLRGLCTAFNAGVGDNPGKALDDPAFTVLITTAGGKDKVADFCTGLLATRAGTVSAHPGASHGAPSTHPGEALSSHPSGPQQTPSHPEPMPTHTH
jgi:hypothetical protein